MSLVLSESERAALADAAARERRVRRWRRYQAVLLVADGKSPQEAAASLGCSRASVYGWLAAWRTDGLAGLVEAPHPPPIQAHAAPLETLLTALLADDPQRHGHHATGWTVPLLHGEARAAGIVVSDAHGAPGGAAVGVALEATEVRARPTRSGIRRKKGAIIAAVAATLAAGGSVWFADETTLREFPPLAGGLGAAGGAGGGDDQRQERAAGAARGAQHRDGRGGAGGARAESGSGQRGVGRGSRGADGGGSEPAGLGQRAAAPHAAGAGDGGGGGDHDPAAAVPLAGVDAVRGRVAGDEAGGGGEPGVRGRGRVGDAGGGVAGRPLARPTCSASRACNRPSSTGYLLSLF